MSLSVQNNDAGNTFWGQSPTKQAFARYNNTQITDTFTHRLKSTPSNNGKFDLSEALKNFAEGAFSPIMAMFSSIPAFLTGAAMVAATVGLTIATSGAIAPLFVAMGIGMGGYQLGSGALKIINAKNGDDAEKAFSNLGGATTAIGLSLLGAKNSLKASGLVDEAGLAQTNSLTAIGKCIKSLPKSISNSFKTTAERAKTLIKKATRATDEEAAAAAIAQTAPIVAETSAVASIPESSHIVSIDHIKEAIDLMDHGGGAAEMIKNKREHKKQEAH